MAAEDPSPQARRDLVPKSAASRPDRALFRAAAWMHSATPATAAAIAALAVWTVSQGWHPFLAVPNVSRVASRDPVAPTNEEISLTTRVRRANTAALVTLAGGLFAVVLAACQDIPGRSTASLVCGLVTAGAVGGMGGDAGGWCGDRLGDLATLYKLGDTARLATIQAVCWSLTGLGIGLGAALSSTADRRATARKAAGGFLGGLLGGGVYPFAAAVAGIFLPDSPTNGLVPESTADQLIWLSAAAISIGVGIQAVGSGQPPADEHGISARRPLFLTGCLIVLLAAWTWQFRPPRSPVPAGSHDSEDDCLPAGSSVDYAADEPAEERKAHLLGLDAESRWITAGERFPELRVGGWLKGHPTAEDLRGRVLVIDVWDGMCIGCRQAVPCLVHAHERFHGRGVAFIGLTAAGRADAERFLGDTQITWPNGYGAKPTLEALGSSVPTIYVIDPDGRICWTDRRARYTHQVAFLAGELKQAIEEALRRQQSTGK